uniref:Uncharacterized protein n=1 Tax=Macaca fascicularis TaxID=9541 RepID=A0A7N9CKU2_MACFA
HDPNTPHQAPHPTLRITIQQETWVANQASSVKNLNGFQEKIDLQPNST